MAIILFVVCGLSATGLAKRPGRLLAIWPVALFTVIAGGIVADHAVSRIQLPDLLEAEILPAARTLTASDGVVLGLCQPTITITRESSGMRGGPLYGVYLGPVTDDGAYVTAFPERKTANAFAALVAAQARQAQCGMAMRIVFKD